MNKPRITVIDSIMGSGKTSWSIQHINSSPDDNFLYITPFLSETDRIARNTTRSFTQPKNAGKGKLSSLNDLLARQEDIAATHELFKHLDETSKELISAGHYTLILDEVLNVLEPIALKKSDLQILLDSGCLFICESGEVIWNPDKHDYDSKYNEIKNLAESHSLICVNNALLMWRYPSDIFYMFDNIYILTYLFNASILKYYFDVYHINYQIASITQEDNQYVLTDYYSPDTSRYRELINIYEGKLNYNIYQKQRSFSKAWFEANKSKQEIKQLQNNLYNYFRNICKASPEEILWTTFKDYYPKLKGKGYTKCFLFCSCRSTNEYQDSSALAYCLNVYPHPALIQFFAQHNVHMDTDLYALSEMLQWIWRSKIRNDEKIQIYIPSNRMRILLYQWMGIEYRPISSLSQPIHTS